MAEGVLNPNELLPPDGILIGPYVPGALIGPSVEELPPILKEASRSNDQSSFGLKMVSDSTFGIALIVG